MTPGSSAGRPELPPADKALAMLRSMLVIRHFELKASEIFGAGKLPGVIHTYVGMEAVAVGVCEALEATDYITSTHRGHGHCIAKSREIDPVMAELFGKRTGFCGGKGGSMHIASTRAGVLGANGIVAAGAAIACGAALTAAYFSREDVAVSFMGEGAVNRGPLHESMNLASIWRLPVIFVVENNHYAVSTPIDTTLASDRIVARAAAYRMPGVEVDGNDVFAVHEAAREAVARARSGGGPTLLECDTYRVRGHFEGDPQGYKSREERAAWDAKCPIRRCAERLMAEGLLNQPDYDKLTEDVLAEVEASVVFAEQSPYPAPEEALQGVYSD